MLSFSLSGRSSLLSTSGLVVLGSDLLKVVVVLLEVLVLNKLNEKLCLLGLTILLILLAIHSDGLSSDLLEFSILVTINKQ